jgi:osmotically-inducible protein OsmY
MKTDRELQRDATAELNWDPSVDASRIDVEAHDGIVMLTGLVNSYAQKHGAQTAAWRVGGVEGVITDLEVELPESDWRSDGDIAKAARNVLAWNASIPPHTVKVSVNQGWIVLSGRVEWEYQSRAAESAMRNLVGIKGLVNLIEIRPRLEPRDATRQIEAALRRRFFRRAKSVSVAVNGGTVTLCGQLDSPSERNAARLAAWRAPGVRNVVDQTTIVAEPRQVFGPRTRERARPMDSQTCSPTS